MRKGFVIIMSLIAIFTMNSCMSTSYVYEGGKRRKAKRSEVKHIRSIKPGSTGRPCSDEW